MKELEESLRIEKEKVKKLAKDVDPAKVPRSSLCSFNLLDIYKYSSAIKLII